jgi:hypothetical protein
MCKDVERDVVLVLGAVDLKLGVLVVRNIMQPAVAGMIGEERVDLCNALKEVLLPSTHLPIVSSARLASAMCPAQWPSRSLACDPGTRPRSLDWASCPPICADAEGASRGFQAPVWRRFIFLQVIGFFCG